MFVSVLLLISFFGAVVAYTPEALADQITSLPGLTGTLPFNHFSGYLEIPGKDAGKPKQLHYWLVESERDPKNDPLTFWTNGGPGCSGLVGFFTEQGPFRPNKDMTISMNEHAWNKVSNMVFIEAPAGVGFSKPGSPADLKTGDEQTAIDNYNLIQAFLKRFPEFAKTEVVLTSESYGGHYLPTLAKQIVDENTAGKNPKINFKGFAVGNPYTDSYSAGPSGVETWWGHQLVSKPLYDQYTKACAGDKVNSLECQAKQAEIQSAIGNLNPYALDFPVCTEATDAKHKSGRAQRIWLKNAEMKARGFDDADVKLLLGPLHTDSYQPCEDNYAIAYLNQKDVKKAIHVDVSMRWDECSSTLDYNFGQNSTAPIYNYLVDGGYGLDILVYSGDDDSVCSTLGTQSWIWGLGYDVSNTNWQPYIVDQQVSGYLTKWKNTKLGFLTVHNAGHEVPTYQPIVALDLFTRFLKGEFTNK
jgi:carboxypeptidase C (cathepsin A)